MTNNPKPDTPSSDLEERVDRAKFAVAKARLQLARLLDLAVAHGEPEEGPLAQDTLLAIHRLDEAFPRHTDTGTGLPLPSNPKPVELRDNPVINPKPVEQAEEDRRDAITRWWERQALRDFIARVRQSRKAP